MAENEYEIETKHYAIICARQREKDKVEAMRYDTMMCVNKLHIRSIFPLYYYYTT